MNVSIHDGLQTTQTSKFVYGLWRPVTAIREADTDLNPATDADPTWLPLITTPPYPSYAGNMACIGASAARALQLAFGTNDVPIKATWRQSGGLPDVTHEFDGFWELAEEQNMARIYGGDALPVRPGRRPADRPSDGRVRVREFHDPARRLVRLTLTGVRSCISTLPRNVEMQDLTPA